MLKKLNFSYCNLEQVPKSIGGLSFLNSLNLKGNNFSSLPGCLSQLSSLEWLELDSCKKLEVLPELPPSVRYMTASYCTSLREVPGSSKNPFQNRSYTFRNCPKLFKSVTTDTEGCISKSQCLDSSITSQGFNHQFSAFLGYLGFGTNRRKFFLQYGFPDNLNITYHGNSIPEWFTNRSTKNHVKVELPSADWSYDKFWGFGTCLVFKRKNPFSAFKGFGGWNFDGLASLTSTSCNYLPLDLLEFLEKEVIEIHESYMIWLYYTSNIGQWKEAKNFVTFSFEENNEAYEVKECGARLLFDGDSQDVANLGMFQDLSEHGGAMSCSGPYGSSTWFW
ncbi:NB-ARC domains-containing protein [Tanacetum coccineum]